MVRIAAEYVDAEWVPMMKEETYPIHSRFQSGCNVAIGPLLSFIGNKRDTRLPYGVVIKEEAVKDLMRAIGSGIQSLTWDAQHQCLSGAAKPGYEDLVIEIKHARRYDSHLTKIRPLTGISHCYFVWNQQFGTRMTGFGQMIGTLLQENSLRILELYNGFSAVKKSDTIAVIKKWMGQGIGLTPSGDDFLLGLMLVNRVEPILGPVFCQSLFDLAWQGGYTTDMSRHAYICGLSGMYSQTLLALYEAVVIGNDSLLEKRTDELLQYGHTSGIDTLAGIMAGFQYLLYREAERAS